MADAIAVLQAGLAEDEPPVVTPPVVEPPAPTPVPPVVQPLPQDKSITCVTVQSTSDKVQTNVPITFGQVFAAGDLPAGKGLKGMQLDVKATHPDGSVRHAVVSTILPHLEPGKDVTLELVPVISAAQKPRKLMPRQFVLARFSAIINGFTYVAESEANVESLGWLAGEFVTELESASPLIGTDGKPHPHLHARFATRCYDDGRVRVDVVVENDWAYEPAPQNFTYDAVIEVGGKVVYEQKNLTHYHHSRWRKIFWHGEEPQVHIRHDTAYLIASRALPNYDQSITITEKTLADWAKRWDKAPKEPMTVGLSVKGMAMTGGRPDIGILPAWSALYLLSMDKRLKDAMLGTADLAGTWSMHYREKNTDQPLSLIDFPYMTEVGTSGDAKNPVTKKSEKAPSTVKGLNKTPYSHDTAHQPGFAYLPYLVTGDRYYLDELQSWAMWNVFQSNPGYRKNVQGLVWRGQVRAAAWCLRTLAQAAYITPDGDRLKGHFLQILKSNIDYGIETFVRAPAANKIGVYSGTGAVVYQDKTAIGTFQDEFLTAALGYVVELGFTEALPLLEWKAKFVTERLLGAGANWLAAANYTWPVMAAPGEAEFITIGQAYNELYRRLYTSADKDDVAAKKRLDSGGKDLGGYPTSPEGFPANMQPAAAYAAQFNPAVWDKFESRDPKPKYGTGPQFAIVPR